ncbi:siderophore-interacting protein [Rudaeicoccus suwonensis]|uniref:NADPH-dependent ferric siderophore reductase n=1 Tax=Rudaeicoccus suwonensis TaxID=657409 RepID=A0A561E7Z1_9MICO|nr:siderophore-interacting protein [Rudaeicoccus suwonensis]TWE11731.1 NADPH-dependent ferric siderophore reductase [Rudaeicoccus suwonensis]
MSTVTAVEPYGFFMTRLVRRERRSPHLVRLTFAGPDLAGLADNGYDQRIKVILPRPGGDPLSEFPTGPDWFISWRQTPIERRAVIRTYTVVTVRPEAGEVDIDFVDHGDTGPGSSFAGSGAVGTEIGIWGPNAAYDGAQGGLEFRHTTAGTSRQLVVGDLTALPAIANIAAGLPDTATGLICIEADADDVCELPTPAGVSVRWCESADEQQQIVRAWLASLPSLGHDDATTTVVTDGEEDAYWEVTSDDAPAASAPAVSAWIAGESGQVRALRRVLVDEFDVPRGAVAFMGYWREGVASAG